MAITLNNVGNVKFLRNGALYATREEARQALETNKVLGADGTALLARYSGETATDVKTIAGLVWSDGTNSTITIIDVEGGSADVEALRQEINAKLGDGVSSANTATAQLEALSGTNADTSATTSVAGAKAYAKDYTDEQIGNLEYTGVTIGDGVVITNVIQADGRVAATSANVGGLKLTDYTKGSDSGAVASTDSINEGFSKVENQIDAVNDKIDNAISGLDYSDTAVAKSFVIEVDETDGVIAVQRGSITSSGESIVLTDNADGGVNFEVNIDNDTIVQDETTKKLKVASAALTQYVGDEDTIHISAVDPTDNTKTISSPLTISATTPTEANVKEQYNLVGASGNTIGATIKIYKDSALYNVYLGHVDDTLSDNTDPTSIVEGSGDIALCFIYHKEDGTYELVTVNVEDFIEENEFASGVTWDSGATKVRGVVDQASESYLTVGADGFKISGIDDAIEDAIEELDATVSNSGTSGHVGVEVVEEDGKLTAITVTTNDIASESDLNALSAKTVTEVASSNASISATSSSTADGTVKYDIVTDASKIQMSGFTADTSGFTAITEATSVTDAVKTIETEIIANEETVSAALTDLDDRVDAISGDVQTISGNVNTISGKVDTIESQYVSGVSVNGNAVTVAGHVAPLSVSGSTTAMTATGNEAIVVNTDANGNITLGLATIDCGTY